MKDYIDMLMKSGDLYRFLLNEKLMSLTPEGWALLNLGNAIDDKASPMERIAIGLACIKFGKPEKSKHGLEVDNIYHYESASKSVHQLLYSGSTNGLCGVDVTTSGILEQGSMYACNTSLNTVLGKPMNAEEAFITKPPDTYTKLQETANSLLRPSKAEDGMTIKRKPLKQSIMPRIYGSGLGCYERVFGVDTPETLAMVRAEILKVPVLAKHKETFMTIDTTGKEYIEWKDFIGRTIRIPINVKVMDIIATEHGNIHYYHDTSSTKENDEFHGHFLAVLAHVIHNADSCTAMLMQKYAYQQNFTMFNVHDAFYVPFDRVNDIRKIERNIRLKKLETKYLENVYRQLGGTEEFTYGDIEQAKYQIINTHLFLT